MTDRMATPLDVLPHDREGDEERERVRAALVAAGLSASADDLKELLEMLGLDNLTLDWRTYLDDSRLSEEERLKRFLRPLEAWSMNTIRPVMPEMSSREIQTIIGRWRLNSEIVIVGTEASKDPKARGRKISVYQWMR